MFYVPHHVFRGGGGSPPVSSPLMEKLKRQRQPCSSFPFLLRSDDVVARGIYRENGGRRSGGGRWKTAAVHFRVARKARVFTGVGIGIVSHQSLFLTKKILHSFARKSHSCFQSLLVRLHDVLSFCTMGNRHLSVKKYIYIAKRFPRSKKSHQ